MRERFSHFCSAGRAGPHQAPGDDRAKGSKRGGFLTGSVGSLGSEFRLLSQLCLKFALLQPCSPGFGDQPHAPALLLFVATSSCTRRDTHQHRPPYKCLGREGSRQHPKPGMEASLPFPNPQRPLQRGHGSDDNTGTTQTD